ncbi:MAG: hypothetical protein ACJASX_001347, partial [Limisphaerales bacterium]
MTQTFDGFVIKVNVSDFHVIRQGVGI